MPEMFGRIRKVLEMQQASRLSEAEAASLLAALSPRLNLSETSWHLFGELLQAGDFSVEELARLLDSHASGRQALAQLGERAAERERALYIEVHSVAGRQFKACLPLASTAQALQLLPGDILQALRKQGISVEALPGLLSSDPPAGELLSVTTVAGARLRLYVA